MRFLKTNTATRVTVGPFLDKTDGITPETALTVTNCKLTLMVDDGGVPTLVIDAAATAAAGDNDMVHVTNDDAGFYDLELTAAQLNYVGRAMLAITDAATHCPVFHEFMILPANVYDSFVGGTDNLQVDTVQVGGTTQTARDIGASVLLSSGTGTGQLDFTSGIVKSNLTQIGGVAQSATDLKDFADTGYDPATHKVQGVVLVDTTTVNTDMVAAAPSAATIAGAVWDEAIAGHAGVGSTGEALAAAGSAGDPWATAIPGAYGAGSAGKILGDALTGHTPQSGDTYALANGANGFANIKSDTAAILVDTGTDGVVVAAASKTGYRLSTTGVDDIWDEALAGHSTAGSAGKALSDAGSAGDPWSTALPGAYGAGTAGKIVGDALTGHIPQTGDAFSVVNHGTYGNSALNAKLGIPAGASVSADIAAVKTDSGNIYTIVNHATYGNAALRTRGDLAWTTATGFSTHSAADVWAVATRALTDKAGFSLSAAGVDDILDEVVEGGITLRQLTRIMAAALAGKSAGGGTATITFTGVDGTTTRITATVDANGNRTAMTLNGA